MQQIGMILEHIILEWYEQRSKGFTRCQRSTADLHPRKTEKHCSLRIMQAGCIRLDLSVARATPMRKP